MGHLTYLYAAVVLTDAALAGIAVWAPRQARIKVAALALAALLFPLAYTGFADLLGKPKPATLEWAMREAAEATVLSAELRENEGIYLWLLLDEAPEPRAYVLPWNLETAKTLERARRQARPKGTDLRMRIPFASVEDPSEPAFCVEPHRPFPPKTAPAG